MRAKRQDKFKDLVNLMDRVLTGYLSVEGDSPEILVQKKLWWILTLGGLPFLVVMSLMIGTQKGMLIAYINLVFGLALLFSLVSFHFHKRHIERYALFVQITILSLTSIKVYLMGGLLEAGGAIFIGLIAPLYALTTRNRKRALVFYLIYLAAMIVGTELQGDTVHDYFQYYYYMGFGLGITIAFGGLYYYTGQLEEMKRQEKIRMEELDTLKNNFYTHITHELRTPLTLILGMTEQIREDPGGNLEEGLAIIRRNGGKLLHMTNQLLDLSRMEASLMPVHWVQQDMVPYLKYLFESFHSFAESKHIELSYSISEDQLLMDFDPEKVRDVVSNLLSNAIKFTPAGGRVELKTQKKIQNGRGQLELLVIDNGPGIAEEHRERIFERYFQAIRHKDEYTEGSGLGLAITRELVLLMNGSISVSSEPDKRTVFKVTLPITNKAELVEVNNSEKAATHTFEVAHPNQEPGKDLPFELSDHRSNRKLKLMIVEDSKDVYTYLNTILSSAYEIVNAWNGEEGFRLALREVPDLIISDVMMPVMNGFAMCQKIKQDMRTSHIPIILLTARNETTSRMEGLKSGADAYLGKPFDKEELLVRVDMLIATRQRLRKSFQRIVENPDLISAEERLSAKHGEALNEREYAFIQRVNEILEAHLSDDEFGISELCVSLGMSRSQLYRKFSALTDSSVNQFIRNLRLNKARELLRTTDLNVAEVAYDTGFKNPSHFSRVYNDRFGVPPSRERENILA